MKNIFLGLVGIFITIYLVTFSLDVYRVQTHKNILERVVSQSVENSLSSQYLTGDADTVCSQLETDIGAEISSQSSLHVEVKSVDLEKGLLSVAVTEEIPLVAGNTKTIMVEKTAIVERIQTEAEKVIVTFLVDGEVYKQYELTKGEICPMPRVPSEAFAGWVEYGTESTEPVESIGEVWEDKVFLAITN